MGWPADVRDVAVLLVSELVANAVAHGAPPAAVSVSVWEQQHGVSRVRVEVHDGAPAPVTGPVRPAGDVGEHGRGLQIVRALAAASGSGPMPGRAGKTSWFELATA